MGALGKREMFKEHLELQEMALVLRLVSWMVLFLVPKHPAFTVNKMMVEETVS